MSATGRRRGERGFTLIEMLVVMAIAGLIAGIAFPAVERALATLAFRSAATQLRLGLRSQRAEAIRTGRPMRLSLSPDGRTLVGPPTIAFRLPEGIALTLPAGGIGFYPDGSANGGTLVLSGRNRATRLRVEPATGLSEAVS
jgi:general secretion pathway protein H